MGDQPSSLRQIEVVKPTFPHICPFSPEGASEQVCKARTAVYASNVHGCCGSAGKRYFPPCDSPRRLCVMCLLDLAKNPKPRLVVNVNTGRCQVHEDIANALAKRRRHLRSTEQALEEVQGTPESSATTLSVSAHVPQHWKKVAEEYKNAREDNRVVDAYAVGKVVLEMSAAGGNQLTAMQIGMCFGYRKSSAQTWCIQMKTIMRGLTEQEWATIKAVDPPLNVGVLAKLVKQLRHAADEQRPQIIARTIETRWLPGKRA